MAVPIPVLTFKVPDGCSPECSDQEWSGRWNKICESIPIQAAEYERALKAALGSKQIGRFNSLIQGIEGQKNAFCDTVLEQHTNYTTAMASTFSESQDHPETMATSYSGSQGHPESPVYYSGYENRVSSYQRPTHSQPGPLQQYQTVGGVYSGAPMQSLAQLNALSTQLSNKPTPLVSTGVQSGGLSRVLGLGNTGLMSSLSQRQTFGSGGTQFPSLVQSGGGNASAVSFAAAPVVNTPRAFTSVPTGVSAPSAGVSVPGTQVGVSRPFPPQTPPSQAPPPSSQAPPPSSQAPPPSSQAPPPKSLFAPGSQSEFMDLASRSLESLQMKLDEVLSVVKKPLSAPILDLDAQIQAKRNELVKIQAESDKAKERYDRLVELEKGKKVYLVKMESKCNAAQKEITELIRQKGELTSEVQLLTSQIQNLRKVYEDDHALAQSQQVQYQAVFSDAQRVREVLTTYQDLFIGGIRATGMKPEVFSGDPVLQSLAQGVHDQFENEQRARLLIQLQDENPATVPRSNTAGHFQANYDFLNDLENGDDLTEVFVNNSLDDNLTTPTGSSPSPSLGKQFEVDQQSVPPQATGPQQTVTQTPPATSTVPGQTATPQPGVGQAATPQPSVGQAATPQPGVGQTATPQPGLDKTALLQPDQDKAALQQPSIDQTAGKQPNS